MLPYIRNFRPLIQKLVALRALSAIPAIALFLTGCGGPDYNAVANRLRESNMQQAKEIADLKEQLANRDATIRDQQARLNGSAPPLRTLAPDRLAELFTPARLEIRSQTDARDLGNGNAGFRVFIRTYAADGQLIPATGALTIEAFETPLSPGEPRRIGSWNFTPADLKKDWYSGLGTNHFALDCPWQSPPKSADILFRARLVDALTGQALEARLDKKVTALP